MDSPNWLNQHTPVQGHALTGGEQTTERGYRQVANVSTQ